MKIAKNPRKTLGMTAVATLSVFLFAAQPSVADDALFASFDKDENGVLDDSELDRDVIDIVDKDRNDTIEPDEFEPRITTRGTTDVILETPEGAPVREIEFTLTKLVFTEADSSLNVWSCSEHVSVTASEDETDELLRDLTEKCERGSEQHGAP